MALMKGKGKQTTAVNRLSEGADQYVRMLRDGTVGIIDWMFLCELEGLVKVANGGGVASSALTFAGAYDADGQDFGLNVPSGTTVLVIKAEVMIDALTDDTDTDINFMTSNTALAGTTGTAVTVVNKLNSQATGSACTCYVAFDAGGGTDVSGGAKAYTFWRTRLESGAAPVAAQSEGTTLCAASWVAPRDGLPAIVVGPGCVAGHVSGSTTGFINVEWIEIPSSYLT